jgi:hypothetical protein
MKAIAHPLDEALSFNPFELKATEGAAILLEIDRFVRRFCVLPTEADHVAVVLWIAHAHMIHAFHTTPRLALLSPEPGSGKTRVLEVLDLLTPSPMFVFSASVAAIFRTMAQAQTTLLFDEVDAIFGKRGKDDHNEDLRALLNVGYRNGAKIPRCVGAQHDVQHFGVFAAVALAGLGNLPDTIMTRAVIVRMRRRASSEDVEPFRLREHEAAGHGLRDRISAWALEVADKAGAAWPELPPGIVDRPAEVWEPLLAVAEAAGGEWPMRAREACIAICGAGGTRGQSLGVRLLVDLRQVFGDADQLYTETLLRRLRGDDPIGLDADGDPAYLMGAPWGSLQGAALDARGLSNLLDRYEVRPTKVREGGTGKALQGYRRADLWDSWERYTPAPAGPEQAEQAGQGERDRSECSACSVDADSGDGWEGTA